MLMEILHFYFIEKVAFLYGSVPPNVMKAEQRGGKHFSLFLLQLHELPGDITKIIQTGACLLLLPSCGTVLCFLSFANRKPNMDKLG